jgi:hypothetical protein
MVDRTPLIQALSAASGRLAAAMVSGLAVGQKPYVTLHALDRDTVCDLMAEAARALAADAPVPLNAAPVTAEPFGYFVEQRLAEPAFLRKPAYIPEPSDLRTVTPLYRFPPEIAEDGR